VRTLGPGWIDAATLGALGEARARLGTYSPSRRKRVSVSSLAENILKQRRIDAAERERRRRKRQARQAAVLAGEIAPMDSLAVESLYGLRSRSAG
jgi:hypothetical protein